jgi:hypothetical protein
MAHHVHLAIGGITTYEAWAVVLSVLAWPERRDDEGRWARSQAALCGWYLRRRARRDPDWEWQPQMVKPAYLLLDADSVAAEGHLVLGRVNKALGAARIARPFINPLISDAPPALPAEITRLSLNAAVTFALDRDGNTTKDPHNAEQRDVRAFFPVLHLATALEQVLHNLAHERGKAVSLEEAMDSPEALVAVVRLAAFLAPLVRRVEQFKIGEDAQITIVPAPGSTDAPLA